MVIVEREQSVLIGRQLEEIAFLFDPFDRRALWPATHSVVADNGFIFGVIGFVAHRIPAGITIRINVAVVGHPLPDRLAGAMMLFFSRADETIERNVQALVHLLEPAGVARSEIGRRHSFGLRGLNHLLTMLVGAGEEEHILAIEARKTRQRIGRDRLISVADMRCAVRVGDGGRDIVGIASGRGLRLYAARDLLCRGAGCCAFGGRRLFSGRVRLTQSRAAFVRLCFLRGFPRALLRGRFFLAAFLAAFFAVFLAVFLAGATGRLLFFTRFFDAAALVAARRVLLTFFALRFLTLFFLAVATTISFYSSNTIVGDDHTRSA